MTYILFMTLALLVILLAGTPVAFSLGIVGIGALVIADGFDSLNQLPIVIYKSLGDFILVGIPLFILIGTILEKGKIGEALYNLAYKWLSNIRGGIAITTIVACVFIAAIVGASMSAILAIGAIAIPQMLKRGYSKSVTYGTVAVGASLGILIPPSVPMLIFSSLTDVSPSKLFISGYLPGFIIASLLIVYAFLRSKHVERQPLPPLKERLQAVVREIPALLIPFLIIVGIYSGWVTPTEVAAVCALYSLLIGIYYYKIIGWKDVPRIFREGTRTSTIILSIFAGALFFGHALTYLRLPQIISEFTLSLELPPILILLVMIVVWTVMGFFMDVMSILLVTVPIFYPVGMALGYHPVWFGIVLMIVMEMAVLTPPVGMNLFAIQSIQRDEKFNTIVVSTIPALVTLIICLILLLIFPQIVTAVI